MRIEARAFPSIRRSSFRSQRHRSVVIGETCPRAAVPLRRGRAAERAGVQVQACGADGAGFLRA